MTQPSSKERWRRFDEHLDHLVDLSPDDRPEYLEALRAEEADGDGLLDEVERVAAELEEHPGDVLDRSVAEIFAELLASAMRESPGSPSRQPSSDADSHSSGDGGRFIPGTVLARRYRIVAFVGRGGMGEVYRADDLRLGVAVALKFLPERMQSDPAWRDQFLHEVRVARGVSHPHVCRVHDVAEADGQPFLTMEYVDGEDLASLLRRIGRLPREKAAMLAREICLAVAAAHREGVLHRDLKPGNILIDGRGRAKITDFGLAARSGLAMHGAGGTPGYMAPEQLEGEPASASSDIFSLGLVLYELFTGERAFGGGSAAEVLDAYRSTDPPALSTRVAGIDPAVERIVLQCLETQPETRPATVTDILASLPGSNPLREAVAAGETPSPDLVAAAGDEARLAPGRAEAWAAWLVLSLAVLVVTGWRSVAPQVTQMPFPPQVLVVKAQELLTQLGRFQPDADFEHGFRMIVKRIPVQGQLPPEGLQEVYRFWYRQADGDLGPPVPPSRGLFLGPTPREQGSYSALLELTPAASLRSFRAPSPTTDELTAGVGERDGPWWKELFSAAQLSASDLQPADMRLLQGVWGDERVGWLDGQGTRVEAVAAGGQPIAFEMSNAGRDPASLEMPHLRLPVVLAAVLGCAWLARRNLRSGRGDRVSARRLGVFAFCLLTASFLLGEPRSLLHGASLLFGLALNAGVSLLLVLLYTAVEPPARRYWPHLFVSWVRLWRGRLGDPLVGRHLLYGAAVATTMALLWQGRSAIGVLMDAQWTLWVGTARPLDGLLATAAAVPPPVISQALLIFVFFVVLVLFRLLLRTNRRAEVAIAIVLVGSWLVMTGTQANWLDRVPTVIIVLLFVAAFFRAGVLVPMVALPLYTILVEFPLTWRPDHWFFDRSLMVVALVLGIGFWGMWTSRGRTEAESVRL